MTNEFTAFSDGSGDNMNPSHPGGAAYIILDSQGNIWKKKSKGFLNTTTNRMELLAIISIVNSLPQQSSVTIYSDSQYSVNVLSGYWNAYNNLDQVTLYLNIVYNKQLCVSLQWVKGHAGNQYNELCDQMAREAYSKMLSQCPVDRATLIKNAEKEVYGQISSKEKEKPKPSGWTNELDEQYYSCITTKGKKKKTKKK